MYHINQKLKPQPTMSGLLVKGIYFLLLLGFPFLSVQAQDYPALQLENWKPDAVLYDQQKWTEVIVGDIPLVISVPHGGGVHDASIPDRSCKEHGRVVTVTDSRTIQTAKAIEAAFLKHFNKRPYIVIAHLSRRKVDQNRDVDLATCGNELGIQAWNFFHQSIDSAIVHAEKQFNEIVYIDLHGHGHKNQRLELGYGLTKEDLQASFQGKQVEQLAKNSSLQNVLEAPVKTRFQQLLFGPNAFGSLIYQEGIPATPSLQDPHPVGDEKFFSGGYNTRRYTSNAYPNVYGWQIEANFKGVRDTDASRAKFAEAFAKAYQQFIENKSQSNTL